VNGLTPSFPTEEPAVYPLEPDDEESEEEDDVGYGEGRKIEAGRQPLEVGEREDGQREGITDDADEDYDRSEIDVEVLDDVTKIIVRGRRATWRVFENKRKSYIQ